MEKSRMMIVLKLVASLAVCQFAALLGSFFTTPKIANWYAFLEKPIFAPPNWVFAPVWTILYLAMGIALFLIWINVKKQKELRESLIYFFIQLALNVIWSAAFFTFQSPLAGLIVIIALFIMVTLTIIKFSKISTTASLLLVPYLLWVGFASFINLFIYFLNK